jgi:hypothetical protein
MSTLSASQSPIVVALGSSGSTTITWDSGSPDVRVKIFERFNQIKPWALRPLVSPPLKGTYTVSLKPGGTYEALMFFEDGIADPNDRHNESPVLAALTVFAILPTPSVLITDGGKPDQEEVGGTFYGRKIATSSPTFATMEIGRKAPVKDAIGQFHIPDAQIVNSTVTGKFGMLRRISMILCLHRWTQGSAIFALLEFRILLECGRSDNSNLRPKGVT